MAQDRSTHDPKTGKKTGSIAFGGKEVPTPAGEWDTATISPRPLGSKAVSSLNILGKVEPDWEAEENPYQVAYTRFEEAHLADVVEGTISFTSTNAIEKEIEASEKAFVAKLDDDGKLDWILLRNAPILDELKSSSGHSDSLFRKMAHFAGAYRIKERGATIGVRTYKIDLHPHWHNGTEDFIRHMASLGMGVEGKFTGEDDETWTYRAVLGSGVLEVDDEARNPRGDLVMEEARKASDERWGIIVRERDSSLDRAQAVYDNAMVVAVSESNRKVRNKALADAENQFSQAQTDIQKKFDTACAESKEIFDAEVDRIRTL